MRNHARVQPDAYPCQRLILRLATLITGLLTLGALAALAVLIALSTLATLLQTLGTSGSTIAGAYRDALFSALLRLRQGDAEDTILKICLSRPGVNGGRQPNCTFEDAVALLPH